MNKRVFGIIGVSSVMSNWNADFSGYPKTISTGEIFGSDKALKYPMKRKWNDEGEKVLYIKSMKLLEGKKGEVDLVPRSLKERYEHLFQVEDLKKNKNAKEVLENLFKAIDVKNFGATFAEEGNNISITGAVQIGQGFNLYENSYVEEQQILSPFRDPKAKDKKDGEEAKNSTLGSKIVSNEAHYFYPFTINPNVYNDYIGLGVTEGYTDEDYAKFKEASLTGVTAYATNSKSGCDNEFAIFIETENNAYIPTLSQFIKFEKIDDRNRISVKCGDLIKAMRDKIKSVEIYYNTHNVDVDTNIEGAKLFDIYTRQEV